MHKQPEGTATPTPFNAPVYVTRPMLADLDAYIPYFKEIWDSQTLTNGGCKHKALETSLAKLLGVPYVKLFNNGTIALLAALRALKLSGEVITTPFTFPATVHSIEWNGMTPVFCDIDPETMCIDPTRIEALITEKTSAIMGVHVYGMPCAVDKIQKIADKHGLRVIYDAAHAFKTSVWGKPIAGFGDISMFSFHATKLFHTFEGGALAFSDPALSDTVDMIKNFGFRNEMDVPMVGINGKMNELQAAVGLVNLDLIDGERQKRAAVRNAYIQGLQGIKGITLFEIPSHANDSLQYMVMRVGSDCAISRDALSEALKNYNVYSRRYFHPLCSDHGSYKHLPSDHLTVARGISNEVLCLPFYGALTLEDVNRIVNMVRFHAKAPAITLTQEHYAQKKTIAEVA